MKKKLVLFTLILGLLLPVFGVTVSAERTEKEWHETDAAAVQKILDDGFQKDLDDLKKLQDAYSEGKKLHDAWVKAEEYKAGMELGYEEAEKQYLTAKEEADKAEKAYNEAVDKVNEAAAELEDLKTDAEKPTQGQLDTWKDKTETSKKDWEHVRDNNLTLSGEIKDLETKITDIRDGLYETKKLYGDQVPTQDNQSLRHEFRLALVELGIEEKFEDKDEYTPDQLDTYITNAGAKFPPYAPADNQYGLLKQWYEKYTLFQGKYTDEIVKDAREAYENNSKIYEELLSKANVTDEQIKAASDKVAEANAKVKEALAAKTTAEEKEVTAKNKRDGALAALSGEDKESANNKAIAARDEAIAEFRQQALDEKDYTAWSTKKTGKLLANREKAIEDFKDDETFKARKAAYDKAVFDANHRPDTITGLKAEANADGTITLSWDAVDTDGVVIYYLGTDGKSREILFELPGNVTRVTHESPELNSKNFYTAIAVDQIPADFGTVGFPGYQTEKDVDEIGWAYAYAKITDRPADVTGLRAVTDKDGYVTVSWNKAEGADYYRLFSLGTDGKSQKMIYEGPATSFQDEKAVATLDGDDLVWNFYTVNAVKVKIGKDETKTEFLSAKTNPAYTYAWADGSLRGKEEPEVGELESIKNMTATTNADGTITVNWSEDPNAFYYVVVYISRTDANGENNVAVQTWKSVSGDTSATFDELAEGYHFFRVYGVNKIDGVYHQSPPADPNYTFAFTAGTEIAD